MGEIFSAFGVDIKLIIIQVFNFGLLLLALWYFLYTPVLKILTDRQEKIAKGIEDAEKASETLNKAGEEKDSLLGAAHKEAGEIVEHARVHAKSVEASATTDADTKAAAILASAEKRGQEMAEKAKSDAEAEIAKTAVLCAEKILTKQS